MISRADNSDTFDAVGVSFFQVNIAIATIPDGINKATERAIRIPRANFRTMIVASYAPGKAMSLFPP
jgi:hypothetical protein